MSVSDFRGFCLSVGYSLLFTLIGSGSGQAQPGLALETYGQLGRLMANADGQRHTVGAVWGGELTISRQTTGRAMWQRAHGLPRMGITLRSRNLGNAAVYGYDLALIPFLEFDLWSTKYTVLQLKHGTGIGYVSKPYDAIENKHNQLVSTYVNAVSLLNAGLLVHGSAYVDVKAGIELSHTSNGNIRQPNKGLNTSTLYAGLRYYPARKLSPTRSESVDRRRRTWGGYVGTAAGLSGADNTDQLMVTPQLETLLLFQHDIRFRAVGGFELSWPGESETYQLGLKLGEEVLFGHLGIRYQVGAYLRNTTRNGPVYSKIGLAWYPLPLVNHMAGKLSIGTSLKAHGLRAAFIEANAGYVF